MSNTRKKGRKMEWNDFLNPRSMLTPGIAGSVVMVIANTLWLEFLLPQKWTALILSFLLIIPILIKYSASIVENVIYFMFNGLIVFALAANSNFAGRKLQEIVSADKPALTNQVIHAAFTNPSAINFNEKPIYFAENKTIKSKTLTTSTTTTTTDDKSPNKDKKDEDKNDEPKTVKDKRSFFGQWF